MKKALLSAAALILTFAASQSFAQTQSKTTVTPRKTVTKTTTVVSKKPTAADLAQGKALLAKSDCLTCHKLDTKVIGPAYKDVAKKYPATEANYQKLTKKVIDGGSGNWGAIAMAPHPLPPADVKKMIEYILSVK